jgi:hypothetical protein
VAVTKRMAYAVESHARPDNAPDDGRSRTTNPFARRMF